MNIHEYQARELLARAGIAVPPGVMATSPAEARRAMERLGVPRVVVKAQVHAGGRGKAGGVKLADSPEQAERVAGQIRRRMQGELDGLVARHGTSPYDFRSLVRALREAGGTVGRLLPIGWPVACLKAERDRRRPPARSRLHAILRDWDLLGFYLPFGWPLLSLTRAFRRPPYGYRGMSRAAAREVQGAFRWRLSEQPLPPRPRES